MNPCLEQDPVLVGQILALLFLDSEEGRIGVFEFTVPSQAEIPLDLQKAALSAISLGSSTYDFEETVKECMILGIVNAPIKQDHEGAPLFRIGRTHEVDPNPVSEVYRITRIDGKTIIIGRKKPALQKYEFHIAAALTATPPVRVARM